MMIKERFLKVIKNSGGATLVYILAAFLIVSFIGVAMTKLAHHDMDASSNYASYKSAEIAANSGIEAAEAFFNGNSDSTIKILQAYINTPKRYWILGDTTSNKQSIDGKMAYAIELVAFSYNTSTNTDFVASIQSYGYGKGSSRKNVISTMQLNNIDWMVDTTGGASTIPMNALHLGGGADEINRPLRVYGDTYISGTGFMYGGSGTFSEFRGRLRVASPTDGSGAFRIKYAHIYGPAYFEGDIDLTGAILPSVFDSGFGCEGLVEVASEAGPDVGDPLNADQVDANVYLNHKYEQMNGSNTLMDLNNKGKLYGLNPSTNYKTQSTGTGLDKIAINCASIVNVAGSPMNLKDSLGFSDTVPKVKLDLSQIRAKAIDVRLNTGNLLEINTTGADMNSLYNDYYTNNRSALYQDKWLVLNYKGANGTAFNTGGAGFTGKVIWLVEDANMECNEAFYEHDTTSGISFIYIGPGRRIYRIGSCEFRGFIYSNTEKECTFAGTSDGGFYGAIYTVDDRGKFRVEGPQAGGAGILDVHYRSDVMNELAVTGIFNDTTIVEPISTDSLIYTAPIETSLLGMQY